MKIVFNYQIFYQQKFGGISNYFFHLNSFLKKIDLNTKFICPLHINNYLSLCKDDVQGFHSKIIHKNFFGFVEFLNKKLAKNYINNFQPDILHDSYYYSYEDKRSLKYKKRVCTVFDMINEIFLTKNQDKTKLILDLKKNTIDQSDHVICISESTKNDLINILGIDDKKITTVHLASTLKKKNYDFKTKKFQNYLLFVGSRKEYKNFYNLLFAFSKSDKLKKDFKIFAYGGERISTDEKKQIKNLKLGNNIQFVSDDDFELSYLYQNVRALIYPSKYEGFGLPILEAMENHCPVISSFGGSLREVGGEGLQYFDPNSIDDIKNQLENSLYSNEKLNELINYGISRNKKFSWINCAKETHEVYKKIL